MNWREEAKEKLRKYSAMRLGVVNIPVEIKRLEVDAKSIRSAKIDATPMPGGGNRREEALLNNIAHRQELTWTLEQAKLWLRITDRALTTLSSEDKQILHMLYIYPQKGNLEQLCTKLNIEKSSTYRRRDKALERFALSLYGTTES